MEAEVKLMPDKMEVEWCPMQDVFLLSSSKTDFSAGKE